MGREYPPEAILRKTCLCTEPAGEHCKKFFSLMKFKKRVAFVLIVCECLNNMQATKLLNCLDILDFIVHAFSVSFRLSSRQVVLLALICGFFCNSSTEIWRHGASPSASTEDSDAVAGLTDRARLHETIVASPLATSPLAFPEEPYLQYCNSPSAMKSLSKGSLEGTLAFEQHMKFKLLQVFMLARHGDRMPVYSFPNLFSTPQLNCSLPYLWHDSAVQANELEFKIWDLNKHEFFSKPLRLRRDQPCSIGSLTSRGHEQHFILGQHFKQAYKKWFNELQDPAIWADFLFVHCTDVQRTVYSAASFLQGFLPKGAHYRSQTPIHISKGLALHGVPPGTNLTYRWCKRINSIPAKDRSSEKMNAGHLVYSNVLDRIAAVLGVSKGKLPPKVTQLYDQIMVRVCHNLTLPCSPKQCTDSILITELAEYVEWFNMRARPTGTAVLMMQPFIYNVLFQQMNSAIE